MKSKTSLFNTGIIINDIRRFWWISALYAIALFFILPFQMLTSDKIHLSVILNLHLPKYFALLNLENGIQRILICTIPVLLGVLLFRYIQTVKSTSFIHSLPLSRKTLFVSHNAVGMAILTVPVLLIGVILEILKLTPHLKGLYSISDIIKWLGVTLLLEFVFFSSSVFTGMFTGNSIAQVVFTYIINILPVAVYVLLTENLTVLLHGYSENYNFPDKLVPILVITNEEYLLNSSLVEYAVITAVLFVAAYCAYKFRKLETAGDIVSFSYARPVFKYGVTICCSLLCGIFFAGTYRRSVSLAVLGYTLGSLAGYIIAEILLQKSFKVWRSYKGYLAFAAVMLFVLLGIKFDFTGYVHRIPKLDDVRQVSVGGMQQYGYNYMGSSYKDRENIKNIMSIHKLLADKPDDKKGSSMSIVYTMKNGKSMSRRYYINQTQYNPVFKPVYESMEYKLQAFPVMTQKADDIKMIEISDSRTEKRPVVLGDLGKIREFMGAFGKDVKDRTFEEMLKLHNNSILISITDTKYYTKRIMVDESYKAFFQWLKSKGYYERIAATQDDFSKVAIEKIKQSKDEYGRIVSLKKVSLNTMIKDKELIKELLNVYSPIDYSKSERLQVDFYSKDDPNNLSFSGCLNPDTPVSEKLKGFIRQLENR